MGDILAAMPANGDETQLLELLREPLRLTAREFNEFKAVRPQWILKKISHFLVIHTDLEAIRGIGEELVSDTKY